MDCELAQQKIALFAYGELPDDQCHLLESHLVSCKRCTEEFSAVEALQQAMSLAPALEPSANLLARARLQLEEALDNLPRLSWIARAQQSFFRGAGGLGRSPVAAGVLLVLGLSGGGLAGYRAALASHPALIVNPVPGTGEIANVSSVVRQPNSEIVEIRFDRLVPETTQGSLDDPRIRELLVAGAQSRPGPVAQYALTLLSDECAAEHQCAEGPIRDTLLFALRHDPSDHVRLSVLNGLKPYIAEDMAVRNGVLNALLRDSDPTVRARAIDLLPPVEADSSVRHVLNRVASEDQNPHIRTVSREVLETPLQIQ